MTGPGLGQWDVVRVIGSRSGERIVDISCSDLLKLTAPLVSGLSYDDVLDRRTQLLSLVAED